MAQTVIGIFDSMSEAQDAVQHLTNKGFSRDQIDVSMQSGGASTSASGSESGMNETINTSSGILGSGRDSTDRNDPSYSTDRSDSSYATDRSESSSSYSDDRNDSGSDGRNNSSFGERVSRFFGSLFGDDSEDTTRYSTVAERGGAILTVHAQTYDEAERAADIMDECGAINVDERARGYGLNSGSTDTSDYSSRASADVSGMDTTIDTTGSNRNSIPVIEENLQVGKREVETGGLRIRSRIIERPVEESLRLREETVRIERTPVNRPATESDLANFREGEIEVRERAEVPIVNKEARVVEEISVDKEVHEREEIIQDTVRKTDVDVEQIEGDQTISKNKRSGKSKL